MCAQHVYRQSMRVGEFLCVVQFIVVIMVICDDSTYHSRYMVVHDIDSVYPHSTVHIQRCHCTQVKVQSIIRVLSAQIIIGLL